MPWVGKEQLVWDTHCVDAVGYTEEVGNGHLLRV